MWNIATTFKTTPRKTPFTRSKVHHEKFKCFISCYTIHNSYIVSYSTVFSATINFHSKESGSERKENSRCYSRKKERERERGSIRKQALALTPSLTLHLSRLHYMETYNPLILKVVHLTLVKKACRNIFVWLLCMT